MTLRMHFALWVAALLLAVLALFGAFVYFNLAHGLASTLDDSLRLSASQAIAAVNIEDGQINFADSFPEGGSVAEELRGRGLTLRILDPAGRVIQSFGPYRALPVDAADLTAARQGQTAFATVTAATQGAAARIYTAPIIENGQIIVTRSSDEPQVRALHGTTRALIQNMVTGVSQGFTKVLEIEGVGYRAEMEGNKLVMHLGYSHSIPVEPPPNVQFEVEERGRIVRIRGIDKQVVGQLAADIRKLRPPEPYKGKGVRYEDEKIRRKAGKTGKAG
jgi:large subunit ribosomal protein L6